MVTPTGLSGVVGKDREQYSKCTDCSRSYEKLDNTAPDLASGWSFLMYYPGLFDFIKNDPRKNAALMDLKTLQTQSHIKYVAGYLNTGYFLNKFLPRKEDVSKALGALRTELSPGYILYHSPGRHIFNGSRRIGRHWRHEHWH